MHKNNDEFYYRDIQQKFLKYQHADLNPKKAALKLIWWNVQWLLFKNRNKKTNRQQSAPSNNTLNIAVKIGGGVGDILIKSTYVKALVNYIHQDNVTVDIFVMRTHRQIIDSIFYNAKFAHTILSGDTLEDSLDRYDLILDVQRFVMIQYVHRDKVDLFSKKLTAYCQGIQNFYQQHRFVLDNEPHTDLLSTRISELNGKNRVNQQDILGILGLSRTPVHFMDLNPDALAILSTLQLEKKKYIIFQRGIDHNQKITEGVRVWPVAHYESLIQLIKQRYPEIVLIQLGFSEERCEKIKGVDIDLRGKTTFEELKILLKYALLLIDYEGGYTHIRHFLNTPSVVLFGPTSVEFLGYPDNINIKNDTCPYPCEWATPNWAEQCVRGFEQPPCMYETKPEFVFQKTAEFIDRQITHNCQFESTITESELLSWLSTDTQAKTAFVHYDELPRFAKQTEYKAISLFSLNNQRKPEVEYSGRYNISAKTCSFELVVAQIDKETLYPGYVLSDLLRIVKAGGTLALKCAPYTRSELAPVALDFSGQAAQDDTFFLITKH